MKNCSFGVLLGVVVLPAAVLSGCGAGGEPGNDNGNNVGEATAEIRLAPPEVRCVVLKTVGSSTVTQQFTVSAGSSTVLGLKGLPTGSDSITAQAFSVACANTGTATATYVSDPVTVTVTLAARVNVSFTMRPAGTTGSGNATVDFPNAHVPTEYFVPAGVSANYITTGPDGNLWFTDSGQHVGRITPSGAFTVFIVPNPSASVTHIVSGPDGNLWFAETGVNAVGRMTTNGTPSEFSISHSPVGITLGPDGNLWVGEGAFVARVTPIGGLDEFAVGAGSVPGIVTGADGNLWFTSNAANAVSRLTPTGTVTHYNLPGTQTPAGITLGPDGNVWCNVAVSGIANVARVTPIGTVTLFPTGTPFGTGIATGADGNLWFSFPSGIGRITTAGVVTKYSTPNATASVYDITAGPDGNLWFTEGYAIAKFTP